MASTTQQPEDVEPTPAATPAGPKKHADEETQGLEKVTDYVEEQEIGELTEVCEKCVCSGSRTNVRYGAQRLLLANYSISPSFASSCTVALRGPES